jgi:catechol 2,3-dioxygenase-like lactoylglutathione lyase family enzyme
MRPFCLAAALAFSIGMSGCTTVPGQASTAVAGASDGTVLRRATLIVHDLDASIAFYQMLGFTRWYEGKPGTISGSGLPVDGTNVGDPTRLVIMKGKHPYIGMIGLLQYGPKRQLPESGRLQPGDAIMMVETEGIAAISELVKERGYRVHKPMEKLHIESVDSEWDAVFLMVFDPDGNLVELTERLN